jgi:hypothetical protein
MVLYSPHVVEERNRASGGDDCHLAAIATWNTPIVELPSDWVFPDDFNGRGLSVDSRVPDDFAHIHSVGPIVVVWSLETAKRVSSVLYRASPSTS